MLPDHPCPAGQVATVWVTHGLASFALEYCPAAQVSHNTSCFRPPFVTKPSPETHVVVWAAQG